MRIGVNSRHDFRVAHGMLIFDSFYLPDWQRLYKTEGMRETWALGNVRCRVWLRIGERWDIWGFSGGARVWEFREGRGGIEGERAWILSEAEELQTSV